MRAVEDEEFREYMRHCWPGLVRLAYGLTGDRGRAEDLVQTVLAKAYVVVGAVLLRARRAGTGSDIMVLRISGVHAALIEAVSAMLRNVGPVSGGLLIAGLLLEASHVPDAGLVRGRGDGAVRLP